MRIIILIHKFFVVRNGTMDSFNLIFCGGITSLKQSIKKLQVAYLICKQRVSSASSVSHLKADVNIQWG